VPSLAANGGNTQVSFVVTATQTITNDECEVSIAGGRSATGSLAVTTMVAEPPNPIDHALFLPLIVRE